MSMFEWLGEEISTVKTPRFHVVDGPASAKLREAVMGAGLSMPSSYKEFVLKFGNARLYRAARTDSYRIGVFAAPRQSTLDSGMRIYHLGFHNGASVYVKGLSAAGSLPIFEFESGSEKEVSSSFEKWLLASCDLARNSYGISKWSEILRGPKPFSREERQKIEARRLMRWRVLGVDVDGNHIFEVTNLGRRALAALTVGVRSKDGRLNGAVRLNIGDVAPGQTSVLHVGCYKGLVPFQEVEVFALPDPNPEDRDYYWEFKDAF